MRTWLFSTGLPRKGNVTRLVSSSPLDIDNVIALATVLLGALCLSYSCTNSTEQKPAVSPAPQHTGKNGDPSLAKTQAPRTEPPAAKARVAQRLEAIRAGKDVDANLAALANEEGLAATAVDGLLLLLRDSNALALPNNDETLPGKIVSTLSALPMTHEQATKLIELSGDSPYIDESRVHDMLRVKLPDYFDFAAYIIRDPNRDLLVKDAVAGELLTFCIEHGDKVRRLAEFIDEKAGRATMFTDHISAAHAPLAEGLCQGMWETKRAASGIAQVLGTLGKPAVDVLLGRLESAELTYERLLDIGSALEFMNGPQVAALDAYEKLYHDHRLEFRVHAGFFLARLAEGFPEVRKRVFEIMKDEKNPPIVEILERARAK
jgi:hypothetical protein